MGDSSLRSTRFSTACAVAASVGLVALSAWPAAAASSATPPPGIGINRPTANYEPSALAVDSKHHHVFLSSNKGLMVLGPDGSLVKTIDVPANALTLFLYFWFKRRDWL